MKVVLLKDVAKLGLRGAVIEVANGYGTNVLIAKGLAKMATNTILNEIKQKEAAKIHKKELAESLFLQMIDKLRKDPIKISGHRHNNGSLFATISANELVDAIHKATGISINDKQVHIATAIKHHGVHEVELQEGTRKEKIQVIVKD
jgi:large subunit ribosomal protein L9